jgi:flagellar hook capping protein FlgD/fibronectin type III domain protein
MRTDVGRARRRQWQHGGGSLLAALTLLLVLAPVAAHAQGANADTVTLSWRAPGDDGNVGTATAYELRMSLQQIDNSTWSAANVVPGTPAPLVAGTSQSMVVRSLSRDTTYYFAIKAVDDVGNWSGLSNVVHWDWIVDTAPPAAPSGLSASRQGSSSVRVAWAANSEPDLAGYNVYRALSASGPYTVLNGSLLSSTQYVDNSIPGGADAVWYQVSADDANNNQSARSSTFMLDLTVQTTATVTTWTLETGYPNPSPVGTTVHLPLVVASAGGQAALEIVNATGQRLRWIDLGNAAPGAREVAWDGRNDAGREVAPGVYTVWLITGATRMSVRLVRVP